MGMFDNAKTVKAAKPAKAGKEKVEVETAGLEEYAALDAAIKALTALRDSAGGNIKSAMLDYYAAEGVRLGTKPDSYTGVEGTARASMELRVKASNIALSADEVELLTTHNIPTQTVVATVETFIINPDYATDGEMLGKIEKALKSVKGIPADLFMKQEEVSKTVMGEGALNAVFKHDVDTALDLLGVCGVPAIKAVLATDDVAQALKIVDRVINPAPTKKAKAA